MKSLVIIPSFNTGGGRLAATVESVLAATSREIVVILDGSTDDSAEVLWWRFRENSRLRLLTGARNRGKGHAVLEAARAALAEGFTHACVFDSDGQHDACDIDRFLEEAEKDKNALVMGVPIFGTDAPAERVKGRLVGNTFAKIETLWRGPEDSLYGMRVYPLAALVKAMEGFPRGMRYEFDTEAAVRLSWAGLRPVNLATQVRYPPRSEGGVTHFHYLRDNLRLILLHTRLLAETPFRLPGFLRRRRAFAEKGRLQ